MGDDFSTLQVYTSLPAADNRNSLISIVKGSLSTSNYIEILSNNEFHNRVIVVGPAENTPWLAVYDSACSYDAYHRFKLQFSFPAFTELVRAISTNVGPAVIIKMDDSCSVAIVLFVAGQLVDRFQDHPTIGHLMQFGKWTYAEQEANMGHPEIWGKHLGLSDERVDKLRQIWTIEGYGVSSPTILENTAKLIGWNEHLCRTGYNFGADGVPYPYHVITSHYAGYSKDDFLELYFAPVEKYS